MHFLIKPSYLCHKFHFRCINSKRTKTKIIFYRTILCTKILSICHTSTFNPNFCIISLNIPNYFYSKTTKMLLDRLPLSRYICRRNKILALLWSNMFSSPQEDSSRRCRCWVLWAQVRVRCWVYGRVFRWRNFMDRQILRLKLLLVESQ